MEYSIDKVNPFCIYTARDLYGLYRATYYNDLIPKHIKYLKDLFINVDSFMNKYIHEMSLAELNLLTLLTLDRIKPSTYFDPDRYTNFKYFTCLEVISVYRCFSSVLSVNSELKVAVDPINTRNAMYTVRKNIHRLPYLEFPEVPEESFITLHKDVSKSHEYADGTKNCFISKDKIDINAGELTDLLFRATLGGSHSFRRPFRIEGTYPIVKSEMDDTTKVRDILTIRDPNTCAGYIRNVKRALKSLTDWEFIELLHTPTWKVKRSPLLLAKLEEALVEGKWKEFTRRLKKQEDIHKVIKL